MQHKLIRMLMVLVMRVTTRRMVIPIMMAWITQRITVHSLPMPTNSITTQRQAMPAMRQCHVPSDVVGTAKAKKAGAAVAFAGDFDGDGYGDYVIGSPSYSVRAAPPVKAKLLAQAKQKSFRVKTAV
jgi:hypothetical protein